MTFVHFYNDDTWKKADPERGKHVLVNHGEGDVLLYALLNPYVRGRLSSGFVEHLESVAWQVEHVETWMGILHLAKATDGDRKVIRETVAKLASTVVEYSELRPGKITREAYRDLVENT